MKTFYKDKVVWITGASSGIGEAIALQLAGMGSKLILSSENPEELHRVELLCKAKGASVSSVILNQSDSSEVNQITDAILTENPVIDVLILNAGISQRASVIETKIEVHDKIMQVNFRSHVQITKKVLPVMVQNGCGHIGVTSSISGKFGFHLRSSYASSKHALHGFFESTGIEYESSGVYVTLVCPGRVKTNISVHALKGDGIGYGAMDPGQAKGISAERCAYLYLKAIKNKRKEKLIGKSELMMVYLKRFFPRMFYALARKIKPI